jgi:hypothetical protein
MEETRGKKKNLKKPLIYVYQKWLQGGKNEQKNHHLL